MNFFKLYGALIIILTIATALSFVWLFFQRKKINAKWWEVLIVSILHTLIGVAFVKLFAIVEAGFNFEKAGNMSLYGGIFFMPLFYFVYAKIKKLPYSLVFDIFLVSLISTLLLSRINCFLSGCCLGKPVNEYADARYPTREIEIGYDAVVIGFVIFSIFKNHLKGKLYSIYMISYGIVRFTLEFMREPSGSLFHIAHLWSIVSIIVGILVIVINYLLSKNKQTK